MADMNTQLRERAKRRYAGERRRRAEQIRAQIEAFEAMKAEHAAAIEALQKKEASHA
ncbi:hypothetical protein [Azotobacter salinestris]|uniref:hypothetical protein n=1 Tax=Azotobacter salinestris TaxID=69964 RepID=UPI0032DEA0AF